MLEMRSERPLGTNLGLIETTADALAAQAGAGVFVDNSTALALRTIDLIVVLPNALDEAGVIQAGVTLSGILGWRDHSDN